MTERRLSLQRPPRSLLRLLGTLLLGSLLIVRGDAQTTPVAEKNVVANPETVAKNEPVEKEKTILYRRWLAPENRFDDWPFGEIPYVPVKRRLFEQWAENQEKSSRQSKESDRKRLSRIVLQATLRDLQLVDGRGTLEFPGQLLSDRGDSAVETVSIPLEPWGLWTSTTDRENPNGVDFVRSSDGRLRLIVPAPTDETAPVPNTVRFNWSLASRPDPRSGLSFDFELPPCLGTELLLDLPDSLVPTCDVGLVQEVPNEVPAENGETFRRWRLLAGRHSRFTLTVGVRDGFQTSRHQTVVQRTLRYTIERQGLSVSSTILFEKTDPPVDGLIFDVESPLRVVSVQYGQQAVPWSSLETTDQSGGSRIHVNLSEFAKRETGDLVVLAMAPLPAARPWTLPRLRIESPNVFWKETRCGLHVIQPLLVRSLEADRAVQVPPRSTFDPSREVFVFQFFEDDARITVDFDEHVPEVTTSGATQFQWGNNEVRGNLVLDGAISEGDAYTLQFPITPHWTIDSVRSVHWATDSQKTPAVDEVLSWDVLEERTDTATRTLSIQLRQPIRPRKSLRIQITGRFQPENRNEFRLHDFSPLSFTPDRERLHYVAVQQSNSRSYLLCRSPIAPVSEPEDGLRHVQRFIEDASGNVYTLDARSRDIRFVRERLKPNYSSDIEGTATLRDKELVLGFDIKCQPVDSSVDRIYVHFAPGSQEEPSLPAAGSWNWTALTESIQPLQVRRLPENELDDLFPETGSRGMLDDVRHGETWEIRLPVPQSGPFELRAVTSLPLTETVVVPLASLPFSSGQRGEMYIRSPRLFRYRVVNTRLKSIPVSAQEWFRYEETRAAFRYNPREEPRLSLQSPLTLRQLTPDEMPPSAWIWSLRLDTQYEPEGIVKNNAIFLIENRGKDKLRIRLPEGIGVGNVHAVWLDDQREIWHPEVEDFSDRYYLPLQGNSDAAAPSDGDRKPGQLVVVSLPEGSRFVTVSLEYSSRDKPLARQRKLTPRYPAADVPILSGGWTSWFPPEFDVSLPHQATSETGSDSLRFSKALGYCLSDDRFDLSSRSFRDRFLHAGQRRQEAETGARIFFDWITASQRDASVGHDSETGFLQESPFTRGARAADSWSDESRLKWSWILGDEKRLADMIGALGQEGARGTDVKVFVDRKALMILGINPETGVAAPDAGAKKRRGTDLFEQSGLVVLVSVTVRPDRIREYTFHITSTLVLSLHRHFHSEPLGPGSRFVADIRDIGRTDDTESPRSANPPAPITPEWISLSQWLRESQSLSLPWSISSQIIRLSSVTPDWNAFEMSQGPDNQLYVVHRKTSAAYYWLAFLTMVVLTLRKPFSHPVILIFLLVLFEFLTRLAVPSQAGIPAGAFLGTLVSLAFGLIRPRRYSEPVSRLKRPRRGSPESTHTDIVAQAAVMEEQDHSGDTSDPASVPPPAILFLLLLPGLSGVLQAETPTTPVPSAVITSQESGGGASQRSTEAATADPPREETPEAYRIFFPVDEDRRVVGDFVYVPREFGKLLELSTAVTEPSQLWSISKAEYRGSIRYNSVSKKMERGDDFSVIYEIDLESGGAEIQLPPLPLSRNRALWNEKPIQPIWRTHGNGQDQILVFNIENERKGRHRLELVLAPTEQPKEDGTNHVEFDIPKVPDATLVLKTTPDTSAVEVSECFGAVRRNTSTSTEFKAELGPVGRLGFSWSAEPNHDDAATIDVEQRFDLTAKSTQLETWVTFAFRVEGAGIRHLNLLIDPHWRLSGRFRCEEHPIETDEKPFYPSGSVGLPSAPNEIVRLSFREPVSGPLTVSAGFVLRDFSGLGKTRLPRFGALNAKVLKSTLSVSAEPMLEVDCPATGLMSGYQAGWTSAETPRNDDAHTVSEPTAESPSERRESPLAEYDLTKTDASWVLAVRTRPLLPEMRLTQAVRFDYGDSALLCQAEFQSPVEVFQQRFSVPDSLRIDSIEVHDSQKKPVEIRWSETERDGPGRCVFFKQPVTGRYSMTIRGGFTTKTDFFDEAASAEKSPLPIPAFENVRLGEQTLNFFRTSSTVVELSTEGTGWTASEITPRLPEHFQDGFAYGSWKRSPGPENAAFPPLGYFLRPNRPLIQGRQITTLSRHTTDSWNIAFDFLWNVREGELDTVRLHWSEQCSVLSIEPAIPYHLELDEGRPYLVLAPDTPLSGDCRLRIRAALIPTGTSVSVPHVGPETDRPEDFDTKHYVILPRYDGDGLIPWSLSLFEEPDEETVRQLETITAGPVTGEKTESADPSENAAAPSPRDTRLFFEAVAEDFSATISRKSTLSVAGMYDVSFMVKNDGILFGVATIDLKNRGQDSVILRMPAGYDLIQVSCGGIASRGARLPGDRWKIDLWTSDYPQRLRILFRGSLALSGEKPSRHSKMPVTLSRLGDESLTYGISLPVLEGVVVQKTFWTLSFDSVRGKPFVPLEVFMVRQKEFGDFSSTEILGERITDLGRHAPVSGTAAMQTLFRLNLLRLANLHGILDSISVPSPARSEEIRRWFSHWSNEWSNTNRMLEYLGGQYPEVFQLPSEKHLFLLDPSGSGPEDSNFAAAELYLEAKNVALPLQALTDGYRELVAKNFTFVDPGEQSRRSRNQPANSLLYQRDRLTEDSVYLFGAGSGPIGEIRIRSVPDYHRFPERLRELLFPWALIPLLLLLFSRRLPFSELFYQFPHFWGAAVGVLLWSLFPPGHLGIAVLFLTFLSLFRPPWPKHPEFADPDAG